MSEADTPIATAPATEYSAGAQMSAGQQVLPGLPQPVTVHPVVQSVVTAVQATNPPENWATTAASVLQGLEPILGPALQVSRASPRTTSEIGLAYAGLAVILSVFFPHPRATG